MARSLLQPSDYPCWKAPYWHNKAVARLANPKQTSAGPTISYLTQRIHSIEIALSIHSYSHIAKLHQLLLSIVLARIAMRKRMEAIRVCSDEVCGAIIPEGFASGGGDLVFVRIAQKCYHMSWMLSEYSTFTC